MNDFKAGTRASNNMTGVVKNLSEEDIENVAAYYANHGIITDTSKKVSKSLFKKVEDKITICLPCHGQIGVSQITSYPHLAGQKDRYLQKEL